MNFCKKVHNANYYASVESIPHEIWEQLHCDTNVYFSKAYLSSLAKHHEDIDFWYVILFDDEQIPVALSTIQIVNFYLDSVQNDLQSLIEWIKCIGRKLLIVSPEKPFKILTCGNTFVSGEYGVFIKEGANKHKVIKELSKSVVSFVTSEKQLDYKVNAFMLKDFEKESLAISDELLEYNYHSFNVEPNMVMQIDADWNNFQDYLAALKTKFRVKAKKAIERSSTLEVLEINASNISQYTDDIKKLYKNVSSKAGFNLGEFNIETYKTLKQNLGEGYLIKAYFLDGNLVGFLSAMVNQNSLDAHFVGIEYEFNREYAVYQRMLYDYIDIAIKRKLSQINFGRTASEIKSSVGAVPQDLTIYLRHKKSIPNKILSVFIKKIQPTKFHQKFPFKAKTTVVSGA